MTARRLFVTGTDTGCGKTLIAAALARAFAARGLRTVAIKPVAAGSEATPAGLRNDDALTLQAAASELLAYEAVNPVVFEPPIAPHIAATESGRALSVAGLVGACGPALAIAADRRVDRVVIEGAGGWRVPLNERETLADLAVALGCDVVLTVGMQLGCINHALLTAEAIHADGLVLAGWVANCIDPAMARFDANYRTLAGRLGAPCLGVVPRLETASPSLAADCLDVRKLAPSAAGD